MNSIRIGTFKEINKRPGTDKALLVLSPSPGHNLTVVVKDRQEQTHSQDKYLIRLFSTCIAFGALVGAALALFILQQDMTFPSLAGAAMSYGALGAAIGMLVAGLFDVVVGGRLEDRPNIE